MSDRFHPISMEQLTDWVFDELEQKNSLFGVPRSARDGWPCDADNARRARLCMVPDTLTTPHTDQGDRVVRRWTPFAA